MFGCCIGIFVYCCMVLWWLFSWLIFLRLYCVFLRVRGFLCLCVVMGVCVGIVMMILIVCVE